MTRRRRSPYDADYRRERRILLSHRPACVHCGDPATQADHQPPLSRHPHMKGSGCCVLVPSCERCSRLQAAELTNEGDTRPAPAPARQAAGFDESSPVWDVPWLSDLRVVPGDAVWPRLMTVPHPDAVGSLEGEFTTWAEDRTAGRLRWWQRLVAARLLEVDAEGRLVWETAVLSMARQLGKSWLLRELLFWRLHQSGRFGCEQLVLHTGKDLGICNEIQREARIWARTQGRDRYKVREANGQEEICYLGDGRQSRWMVRAWSAVYGIAATMVGVDECWKVTAEAIEEGVVPTLVEAVQPQMLLISTAHRAATSLMLRRRADAMAVLGSGTGDLLVEWSSSPTADLEDREAWRSASPHWTARRERLIAQRVAAALAGRADAVEGEMDQVEGVRGQWLNIWPSGVHRAERGEAVVDPKAWAAALCTDDTAGPLAIGVADHHGRGAAVAFCGTLPDGRLVVGGDLVDSRDEAWGLAQRASIVRPGSMLATSKALASDRLAGEVDAADVVKSSTVDTGAAVATVRDLLDHGRLVQDGSPDLTAQLGECRVNVAARLSLLPVGRHDLVEAMLWAVRAMASTEIPVPAIY